MRKLLYFAILSVFIIQLNAGDILKLSLEVPEITDVTIHEGKLFVLSGKLHRIYIYSMDGKLLKELGRKGKGPGELSLPARIYIVEKWIYVFDPGNGGFQVYDLSGKYIKTINFQNIPVMQAVPFKDVIFFVSTYIGKDKRMVFKIFRKAKEEKEIGAIPGPEFRGKEMVFPPETYPGLTRIGDTPAVVDMKTGRVKLYNRKGTVIGEFEANLPMHRITEEWKKDFLKQQKKLVEMMKAQGFKFTFRKRFPGVEKFYSFGKCLVLKEWRSSPPHVYHFYDNSGKELKSIELKKKIFKFSFPFRIIKEEKEEGTDLILIDEKLPQCAL